MSTYVNSPGAGPYSLSSLSKRRRIGIPDLPPGVTPKGLKPKRLTDTQLAQEQIAPLVKAITDRISGQAHAAGSAITGYTDALAHALSQMDFGSPYSSAIPQQAGVDAALQQSLTGKGNDLAQGLSDRLKSIQEPGATDPAVQAVQQFGAASGNTQLAQGSAALTNLLANQAAAREYGAKQPGIARLAGLQELGKNSAQAQQALATQTGELTAKVPDIVASIRDARVKQQQVDLENRLAAKQYGLKVKTTNASITHQQNQDAIAQARVEIAKANQALAKQKVAISDAHNKRDFEQKVAAGAKPNASLSRIYGHVVDSNGNPILNSKGQQIPVAKSTKSSNPFDTNPVP